MDEFMKEIAEMARELTEMRKKTRGENEPKCRSFSQDRYANAYDARNGRRMKKTYRPKINYYD